MLVLALDSVLRYRVYLVGMNELTTGAVAGRAGVNVETLRYYERRGLLKKPARTLSNYRLYDEESVRRIRFIKRAQELGFTLQEIQELLKLRARPRAGCADVQNRAQSKIADIEARIRSLNGMKKALSRLVAQCSGSGPITDCPILEALDEEDL